MLPSDWLISRASWVGNGGARMGELASVPAVQGVQQLSHFCLKDTRSFLLYIYGVRGDATELSLQPKVKRDSGNDLL